MFPLAVMQQCSHELGHIHLASKVDREIRHEGQMQLDLFLTNILETEHLLEQSLFVMKWFRYLTLEDSHAVIEGPRIPPPLSEDSLT